MRKTSYTGWKKKLPSSTKGGKGGGGWVKLEGAEKKNRALRIAPREKKLHSLILKKRKRVKAHPQKILSRSGKGNAVFVVEEKRTQVVIKGSTQKMGNGRAVLPAPMGKNLSDEKVGGRTGGATWKGKGPRRVV